MKSFKRIFPFTLFLSTLLLCFGITFKDKQQNMVLENLTSWRMTKTNEQTFKFQGEGHPLKGFWKDQHLSIHSNFIHGLIESGKNQDFELVDAYLRGNVLIDLTSFPKIKPGPAISTRLLSPPERTVP